MGKWAVYVATCKNVVVLPIADSGLQYIFRKCDGILQLSPRHQIPLQLHGLTQHTTIVNAPSTCHEKRRNTTDR